jgi:hypothetical protein
MKSSSTRPARAMRGRWTLCVAVAGGLAIAAPVSSVRAAEALGPLPARVGAPKPPATRLIDEAPDMAGQRGGLTAEVQQSIACVLVGGTATAGALSAGAENLVSVVAGGAVPIRNTAVLYLGVVGVVFATFCALGQALTPLALYAFEPVAPPPEPTGPVMPSGAVYSRAAWRDEVRPSPETRRAVSGPLATMPWLFTATAPSPCPPTSTLCPKI